MRAWIKQSDENKNVTIHVGRGGTNIVSALFYDNSIIHDVYVICLVQHMQSMRNEDPCPIGERAIE